MLRYRQYALKKKSEQLIAEQNLAILLQNKALEEANTAKKKLLSIIAHDLIGPFNTLMGYTNLLQKDFDRFSDEQKKKFIKIINNSATQNYNLTKDLLTWAKSQHNYITANLEPLNCKSIIEKAIQPHTVLAAEKYINVTHKIPEDLMISSDINIIHTVIGNIFTNAVRYTSPFGSIYISAKSYEVCVKIEIRDTGVGISEPKLNKLFNPSKDYNFEWVSTEKGNGLGLMLCKELLSKQKCNIEVDSTKGKGTVVRVIIPYQ